MSVVVAIKEGDTVYMGGDTQHTCPTRGEKVYPDVDHANERNFKIAKLDSGVLIGYTGSVFAAQRLLAHAEWFDDAPRQGLSKRFVVEKVLPKLLDAFKADDLISGLDAGEPEMDLSLLIAYQDALVRFDRHFDIVEAERYGVIGSGSDLTLVSLSAAGEGDVRTAILEALKIAAKYDLYVGGPFSLIDTKALRFEVAEG